MDKRELRMFNPFLISQADSLEISRQYEILQDKLDEETDIPYQISKNIEIYANMNYLIGEMIARISEELNKLKTQTDITQAKQVYMQRKQWGETNKDKTPAMSYFEALATEYVKDDLIKIAELDSRLKRFKVAYDSIESKQNAMKKKIEAIKYET